MFVHRLPLNIASLLVILSATASLLAQGQPTAKAPKQGTDLENYIPTTTTWVVLSPAGPQRNGTNTCLAGIYRKEKTISIYTRGEGKELWSLLQTVDRALADHPQIKAYVVIHKELRSPQGFTRSREEFIKTRELALPAKLKKVDVSLSRNTGDKLIGKETSLKFVYSEERIVKISKNFGDVEEAFRAAPDLIKQVTAITTAK